jgi:hypothetical protein
MMTRVQTDPDGTQFLMFRCPGCETFGVSGIHRLAVNSPTRQPSWEWDGNETQPTLSPSILSDIGANRRCHSYLRGGVFTFLTDSTHRYAGQDVPIPELWPEHEESNDE